MEENEILSQNESSSRVENYLEGVAFPSDKQTLIAYASQRGAPEEVLQLLDMVPDKPYADLAEITDAILSL